MTPKDVSLPKLLHILIVDDDETMRSLLRKTVQRLGAQTTEAENAETALQKVHNSQPLSILCSATGTCLALPAWIFSVT
jgi:CheY-like chemotaxis protein